MQLLRDTGRQGRSGHNAKLNGKENDYEKRADDDQKLI